MRYLAAVLNDEENTAAYRIYTTDCLGAIVKAKKRYYDIINPPADSEQSYKTGDEIAADVIMRLRKEYEGKEE